MRRFASLVAAACASLIGCETAQQRTVGDEVLTQETSSAARLPEPKALARDVAANYAAMKSYDVYTIIRSGGTIGADQIVPDREALWVRAHMEPGKIRTEVGKPGAEEPFYVWVDDGAQVWEEAQGRRVVQPRRDSYLERNANLAHEIGLDGCLFGNFLSSWVGDEESSIGYVVRHIGEGKIVEASERGRKCWLASGNMGGHGPDMLYEQHEYWIDQQTLCMIRRDTSQTAYTSAGNILQVVKRTYIIDSPASCAR
jgi:hypothetical protein